MFKRQAYLANHIVLLRGGIRTNSHTTLSNFSHRLKKLRCAQSKVDRFESGPH